MPLAVHCANCGAPFSAEAMRFCAWCGTQRPTDEPEIRHVFAPNAPERWGSAQQHPAFDELMRFTPPDSALPPVLTLRTGIFLCVAGIFGTMVAAGAMAEAEPMWMWVVPALFLVAVGAIAFGLAAEHRALRKTPWQRLLVVVLDKRTEVDHRRRSRVIRHHVTLRQLRGAREWRCEEDLYRRLRTGQMGIAYTKVDRLVDFRALPV